MTRTDFKKAAIVFHTSDESIDEAVLRMRGLSEATVSRGAKVHDILYKTGGEPKPEAFEEVKKEVWANLNERIWRESYLEFWARNYREFRDRM